MSLLVGVRSSSRDGEGQSIREGIIQQPSPFFNSNPSSSIWGNTPAPSLWRDAASASSKSSSQASRSEAKKQQQRGGGGVVIEEEEEVEGGQAMEEKDVSRLKRAVGDGSSRGKSQPPTTPFSFGFPETSPSSLPSRSQPWRPTIDDLASGLDCSSSTFFREEAQAQAHPQTRPSLDSSDGSFAFPHQSSTLDFDFGSEAAWGIELGLGNGQVFSSSSQQQSATSSSPKFPTSIPSTVANEGFQAAEPSSSTPSSGGNSAAGWRISISVDSTAELGPTPSPPRTISLGLNGVSSPIDQKNSHDVFIFGASGGSGPGAGARTGFFNPKHSAFSVPGTGPRSRFVKVKKPPNAIKGKAPAVVSGAAAGQTAVEDSNSSVFSSAGLPAECVPFVDGEGSGSSDANSCSGADFYDGGYDQGRKSDEEPPLFPLWSELQAFSGHHAEISKIHSPSGMGTDQCPSVSDSQAKSWKIGRNEKNETDFVHSVDQQFSFWDPFLQNRNEVYEDITDNTGAGFQQSYNEGKSFRAGMARGLPKVERMLSEEHVADVIAGIANGEDAFARQGSTERFNSDLEGGGLNWASRASGILSGDNPSEEAKGASNDSQGSGRQVLQPDPCVGSMNSTQTKQDETYDTLFQHFSKLGPFQVSPDGCKEKQEPKSLNIAGRPSQDPFIFRASKPQPSVAIPGRVEPSVGFDVFNASGNPLASSGFINHNDALKNVQKLDSYDLRGSRSTNRPADARSAMPSFPSSNAAMKVEIGSVDILKNTSWLGPKAQPFMFSAGSGSASPLSSSYSGRSMLKKTRQCHSSGPHEGCPMGEFAGPASCSFSGRRVCEETQQFDSCGANEGPIGEFAGTASSSESSMSEFSPSRGEEREEQWAEADDPSSASHSFEFRAGNKGMDGGGIFRRKKDKIQRLFSINRRQGKRLFSKTNMNSIGNGVSHVPVSKSTDFSPHFEAEPQVASPLGSGYNTSNLEQPPAFWRATDQSIDSEADYRDEWEHLVEEDPRVEELRAAAADLNIGNEQDNYARNTSYDGSESAAAEHYWWRSDFSSQRSGKWKRAVFEEEQNVFTGFQNAWLHTQREKYSEKGDEFCDHTSADVGSNQRRRFTFTASSPPTLSSSMLRRHARRIQREKVSGPTVDLGKIGTSGNGVNSFSFKGSEAPETAGPGNISGKTATSAGQAVSNHGLPTTDVNIRESFVNNVVPGGDISNASAHTADLDKTVSAFSLRTTDSLSGDPSVPSSAFAVPGAVPGSPRAVKSVTAEQVCERWRLRGNQAYTNGDFPKAEEYYSRGASSVSPNETSQSCIRASMLCYSNRAATRMAVGRMREALADCMRAMAVDPSFLRVRLRAASCHLSLGESKAAVAMFKECLMYAKEGDKPDSKTAVEAAEGMKKAQQLDDYSERAVELLGNGSTGDVTSALRLLNEALLISPHSERVLEMKAQALFSFRRFEEVIQLCEQSLASAERNHVTMGCEPQQQVGHNSSNEASVCGGLSSPLKLWRWRMTAKSLFHLGRLEEAMEFLIKHEEANLVLVSDRLSSIGSGSIEPLAPLIANIRDLLRHKAAGNEAFQAGKHAEAIEHYSAALACNGESRPFIAVCFCNRAAASQALGHIADAIADCSRSIALDPHYAKAISRRATLHEMVRDYGQACHDLRRLVEFLENHQQQSKISQTGRLGGSNSSAHDLRQAHDRLAKAEEDMRKGHPLDHYLILGVDPSCSANEIKKSYRKAALKHHPDKAGQFLVRGENGDDAGVWKEVGDDLRSDAERLFKMIGESYAILSDPTKRLRYDNDEELRKLRTRGGSGSMSGISEPYRSQYEKGTRRQRERWDSWNGYANQHQRWQSGPDAAQPDTYARRGKFASNGSKPSGDGSRNADLDWDEL